jgi:glycosyltransferase involved in cell wall biosynthesis
MQCPSLSVVMPVYNASSFLDEAIRSILNQTFTDFEFVIFDDGSTDESIGIIEDWKKRDARIRVHRSDKRLGLSVSSIEAVALARAPIVARMDADDRSHPDRLKREWEILAARPEVVLVGTLADGIDGQGNKVRSRDRWRIVRRSRFAPFPHGSVMFRKDAYQAVGGYCPTLVAAEDQDLYHKLTSLGLVTTLPDLLYHYRYHSQSSTALPLEEIRTGANQNGGHFSNGHYSRGAMRLWAGGSPAIWHDVVRADHAGRRVYHLAVLAWAGWGELSPGSLRFCVRAISTLRDRVCGLLIKDGRPYEWRFER